MRLGPSLAFSLLSQVSKARTQALLVLSVSLDTERFGVARASLAPPVLAKLASLLFSARDKALACDSFSSSFGIFQEFRVTLSYTLVIRLRYYYAYYRTDTSNRRHKQYSF